MVAMAGGGDGPDEADGAGDGDEPDDGLDDDDSSMELAYTTPTVIQKKLGMWKRIVGAICRAFEEVSAFPNSYVTCERFSSLARYVIRRPAGQAATKVPGRRAKLQPGPASQAPSKAGQRPIRFASPTSGFKFHLLQLRLLVPGSSFLDALTM